MVTVKSIYGRPVVVFGWRGTPSGPVHPLEPPTDGGEPHQCEGGGDVPLYIKMVAMASPSGLSTANQTGVCTGGEPWRAHWDQATGARTGREPTGAHWDHRAQAREPSVDAAIAPEHRSVCRTRTVRRLAGSVERGSTAWSTRAELLGN